VRPPRPGIASHAGIFNKRMMGLEPTTFCMAMLATVRTRSRPFAQTTCLQRLRVGRANGSEPQRTPSAAIAAIVIAAWSSRDESKVRRNCVSVLATKIPIDDGRMRAASRRVLVSETYDCSGDVTSTGRGSAASPTFALAAAVRSVASCRSHATARCLSPGRLGRDDASACFDASRSRSAWCSL
jgi:hypothetical protein